VCAGWPDFSPMYWAIVYYGQWYENYRSTFLVHFFHGTSYVLCNFDKYIIGWATFLGDFFNNSSVHPDCVNQGCQMVCFQTKNPKLGKFWRALEFKKLVYSMVIWSILRPFGIFYARLVCSGNCIGIFPYVLVYWIKKNLAALVWIPVAKRCRWQWRDFRTNSRFLCDRLNRWVELLNDSFKSVSWIVEWCGVFASFCPQWAETNLFNAEKKFASEKKVSDTKRQSWI
jgi:hypothetical protein